MPAPTMATRRPESERTIARLKAKRRDWNRNPPRKYVTTSAPRMITERGIGFVVSVAHDEEHETGAEAGGEDAPRLGDARVPPDLAVEPGQPVGRDVHDDRDRQEVPERVPVLARHLAVEAQQQTSEYAAVARSTSSGSNGTLARTRTTAWLILLGPPRIPQPPG